MASFLSFQNPIEVPGITLGNFIRTALEQTHRQCGSRLWDFRRELKKAMDVLQMDESYAERDLNVGFSGGEKKKAEILQLLMLQSVTGDSWMRQIPDWMWMQSVLVSSGVEEYQKN